MPNGDDVGALAVAVPPLSWKLRHVIPQLQCSGELNFCISHNQSFNAEILD